MGLPVFKHEFEEALSAMPALPELIFSEIPRGDPLASISNRHDALRVRFEDWRFKTVKWLPELRSVFERASKDNDVATINSLIDEALPELLAVFDNVSMQVSDVALQLKTAFEGIERRSPPELRDRIGLVQKNTGATLEACQDIVRDIRSRIKAMEWEFDPSARGGPSFDNADDLIASLNS